MQFYIFGGVSMPANTYFNDLWMLDYSNFDMGNNTTEATGFLWNEIETQGSVK